MPEVSRRGQSARSLHVTQEIVAVLESAQPDGSTAYSKHPTLSHVGSGVPRPTLSHRVLAVTAAGTRAPRSPWGIGAWWENAEVKAKLVTFGEIQINGERYRCDVVIEGGRIRRRRKGPSKPLRDRFGHTPLSVAEDIPWGGQRLIVGTGAGGALPVAPEVYEEGARRGIAIEALPTRDACRLLAASGHPRRRRPGCGSALDSNGGPRCCGSRSVP